ncbi:MAG: phosphodiester glycosidase family protein [Pseudomonadota bacterium]
MWTAIKAAFLAGAVATTAHGQTNCAQTTHLDDSYTICAVADANRIGLWLNDDKGELIGDFDVLEQSLSKTGKTLEFAMNGGMYHEDRRAVGLFINDQGQQQSLMTREGPGNFGLLPNGVFCVAGVRAQVIESLAYAENIPDCRIATQSGPMLVIDGAVHPKFLPDSTSRKWRNGIGVDDTGTTYFAISDGPVRFHDFATLFKDVLKTPNALYLDGSISRMHAPALGRSDGGAQMGPILGVVTEN